MLVGSHAHRNDGAVNARQFFFAALCMVSAAAPAEPNPRPRQAGITFGILQDRHATALWVSDDEAAEAVRFAWEKHGLTVEPGGAVALAALLSGKLAPMDDTVVVLSGGNIDPALHARIIAEDT